MVIDEKITESITLREAVAKDTPFLDRLYCDTRRAEVSAWGWSSEQQEWFLRMQFDAQRRSYQDRFPKALNLIVFRDDAPIGRLLTCWEGPSMRLIDVALLSEHRRLGIGTFLLRSLLEECQARDCVLRLQVSKDNPAMRLYKRLGFVHIAGDQVYLQMEWRPPSIQKAVS